jgi:hypothetical protein
LTSSIGSGTRPSAGRPWRVLICAPSNGAVSEIVRRLLSEALLDATGKGFRPRIVLLGGGGAGAAKDRGKQQNGAEELTEEEAALESVRLETQVGVRSIASSVLPVLPSFLRPYVERQ